MKSIVVRSLFFLIAVSPLAGEDMRAQDNTFFKDMIKESVSLDMVFEFMQDNPGYLSDSLSRFVEIDVNKKPLLMLRYNYKMAALMKEVVLLDTIHPLSPTLFAAYTGIEGFDPNSTETVTDIVANGILTPLAAIGTFNILVLADYLMRIGVLPSEPFVPREKKKDKALRGVKIIYNLD